jgi:hypothetical protein
MKAATPINDAALGTGRVRARALPAPSIEGEASEGAVEARSD